MKAGAEDGLERKMMLPSEQVRKPPRNILKFMPPTIVLIILAQFPLEGEENP